MIFWIIKIVFFSVGEWEIYLIDNSFFIFYGMEKFINYILLVKFLVLNILGKFNFKSNMI